MKWGIRPKLPWDLPMHIQYPQNWPMQWLASGTGGWGQLGKTLPYLCPKRVGELTKTWLARTLVQVLRNGCQEIDLECINYAGG
jgi:hypothetical protein